MKDLAAKFHNWSKAGSVEVCYVQFRNVSTFQLDNKIHTLCVRSTSNLWISSILGFWHGPLSRLDLS